MANLQTELEPSSGETIENPTREQIRAVLDRFGKDLEHCNFTYGEEFVSASGDAQTGIHLYYVDGEAEYTSGALEPDTVCDVFLEAAGGESGWKTRIEFTREAAAQTNAQGRERPTRAGTQTADGSLKDQLLGAARSEAARGFKRLVRNIVRNLFRG